MRVVQLVMARQFRGAELFASQLSQELAKQNVQVMYVSLFLSEGKQFHLVDLPHHDLNFKKQSRLSVGLIWKLYRFLRKYRPDVVQANSGDTLKYAILTRFIFGLRYRVVARNASMVSQYISSPLQKGLNWFLYKKVDFIIAVSKKSLDDLILLFPFCHKKCEVIPIGLTLKTVQKLSEFDSNVFNLLHVGGFTFEKNHAGLLRIFFCVLKIYPQAKLWLLGDGPLMSRIKEQVAEMKIIDNVIFKGAVSNPLDFIRSSQVILLPSHIEGLPGVILEAFYCKTPVIAYNVGGISELIEDDVTGHLIDCDDELGFASKIVEVISNMNAEVPILKRAYLRVTSEFSMDEIGRRFLMKYSQLVK